MMHSQYPCGAVPSRRRAVVIVQVIVLLTTLMAFGALSLDIGTLYRAREDLQDAADSAAMAAVSAYTTDAMLQIRWGGTTTSLVAEVDLQATLRATQTAGDNYTLGAPTLMDAGDFSIGWIDIDSSTALMDTSVVPANRNAVQVILRKEALGSNGPVPYYFAPVLGDMFGETSALAVAVIEDRYNGYDVGAGGAGTLPISVDETIYYANLAGGSDNYSYDSVTGIVSSAPDGVAEITLFPFNAAPGNFGLLNIGTPNQGVPALSDQILNGITPADMTTEVGTAQLMFFDSSGSPVSYTISGDPGMKSALESSFLQRVGDTVSFFLHDGVTGTGANSQYNIVEVRFGRVMDVKLNGPPSQRGLWVQPTIYAGGGAGFGPQAPSSNGMVVQLQLAR